MALITKAMRQRLHSLNAAAHSGQLPRHLASFLSMTVMFVLAHSDSFRDRKTLSAYIDTLTDLIDTKVHSR